MICQRCLKESYGRNEVNSYTVSDMSEMFEGELWEKKDQQLHLNDSYLL